MANARKRLQIKERGRRETRRHAIKEGAERFVKSLDGWREVLMQIWVTWKKTEYSTQSEMGERGLKGKNGGSSLIEHWDIWAVMLQRQ